jgi:hypothetical protein
MTNEVGDLYIHYDLDNTNEHVRGWCTRWDTQNKLIMIECILNKEQTINLRENITPNAVDELYVILENIRYYDSTWQGENTIKIIPNGNNLENMRDEYIIYVKNFNSTPLSGPSKLFNVKIEGYISGGVY